MTLGGGLHGVVLSCLLVSLPAQAVDFHFAGRVTIIPAEEEQPALPEDPCESTRVDEAQVEVTQEEGPESCMVSVIYE